MPNFTESLPELFEKVSKTKGWEEKLALLRGHPRQQVLQTICQGAYHEGMTWGLPEGIPPFKESAEPYGMTPSMLEREVRKLPYLITEHPQFTPEKTRREKIYIDMLEQLHPSEASIINQMKAGEIFGVPHDLVFEAWPNLVTPPPEKPKPVKAAPKKKKKKSKKSTTNEKAI